VLDHGLPTQCLVDGRERTVVVVDVVANHQLRQELACARVDDRDLRRARLGDDQRVPEARDCHREPSPLPLQLLVGGYELVGHRVERPRELLQLPRPCRLHAGPEATRHQASRRLHEVVERRLHSADQSGDQRQRADDREHPGDRHEQQRPSRRRPRVGAGCRLAGQLARLELIGQRTRLGKGARRRRRDRGAALCRKLPGPRLGGDLSLREAHADGIVLGERHDIPRRGGERGSSLGAGSRSTRSSGVTEHLLLGHPSAAEVRGRRRQRCTADELVLVVLTRCVEARHAHGRDHR
jgi:hypothetical protein